MFSLATDVQKIILEYLEPQEIKVLYESYEESKAMFDELIKHTNIVINCKRILSEKEIKWFKLKNIRLKLFDKYININGNQLWFQNGKRHRDNDLPAGICVNGDQYWFKNGLKHRDNDLPAVICVNGDQHWFQNGLKHRDNNLPAIILSSGNLHWYKNGNEYRGNHLPAVIFSK